MEHLNMQTPDGAQLNLDALYKLCPSCFTEGKDADGNLTHKINWNKLRELLGDNAEENAPESYDFTWVGKRAAQREAAAPINKTLRPCPEESVDWENTQNLYIEGDNLEVLKLLQNSYMGKVKMIYIDPPYNTGNDFVYHDDFAVSAEEYDENNINEAGERFRKNTDSNGRFHSDWCSMMYARLVLARTLLREDGVIFVSIDDAEQKNLKNICDEVFGNSNFISQVIWERAFSPINLKKHFSVSHDYIIAYAKNIEITICNGLPRTEESDNRYKNLDNDPRGNWTSADCTVGPAVPEKVYPITLPSGRVVFPTSGRCWLYTKDRFEELKRDNRIWFGEKGDNVPRVKKFISEVKQGLTPMSIWKYDEVGHSQDASQKLKKLFDGKSYFDYPKPVELIKRCVQLYSEKESIILDFFSGSGTTAQSVIELNSLDDGSRKFVMVQIQEETEPKTEAYDDGYRTICDIAKERIKRAGAKIKAENPNVDTGFRVFKCDSSNMKDVYFHPNDYSQDLLADLEDNIKEDRTDLDLLFDCMLRWGVELSLPLSQKKVGDCTIHNVNDGDLVACFDGKITEAVIDEIAAMNPLRVVFRDSSFEEASEKMNLFELFKQKCQWSEQEVKNNVRVI